MSNQENKLPEDELNNTIVNDSEFETVVDEKANVQNESFGDSENDTLYYLDLAQRIKADFDNYKRRNEQTAKISYDNGLSKAVETLLPMVDTVTRAKANITDEATLQGFEMINNQFIELLSKIGVSKIDSVGTQFDPNLHNAILTASEDGVEDGVVLEEFQQGFKLGDKVIRHSVVKINRV